jgi:hypothetical protein
VILLVNTTDKLQLVTGTAADIDGPSEHGDHDGDDDGHPRGAGGV